MKRVAVLPRLTRLTCSHYYVIYRRILVGSLYVLPLYWCGGGGAVPQRYVIWTHFTLLSRPKSSAESAFQALWRFTLNHKWVETERGKWLYGALLRNALP
jgi:hypothetical protein